MKKITPLLVLVILLILSLWVFLKPEEQNIPIQTNVQAPAVTLADQVDDPGPISVERKSVQSQVHQPKEAFVSGVVLGPDGKPVAGAQCGLSRLKAPDGFRFREAAPNPDANAAEAVLSNRAGEFQIPAAAGYWRLKVQVPGMAQWEDAPLQSGDFRWVRLEKARGLSVQVWNEQEQPVSSAKIQLVKTQSASFAQRQVEALTTDSLGFATFDNFPSGKWFLRVSHPSYAGQLVEVLPSSSPHQKIEVHLVQGVRVFGHVYVGQNQAIPSGGMVYLDGGYVDGFSGAERIACASDGSYESNFAFQPGQSLEITAVASGFGEKSVWPTLTAEDFEHGIEVDIHLGNQASGVMGRVVNKAGEPIPNVEFYGEQLLNLPHETKLVVPSWDEMKASGYPSPSDLAPQHSPYTRSRFFAKTNQDGRFEIMQLDPAKGYEFQLSVEQYANQILYQVDSPPGQVTDLGDIVMHPAGKVFGRVIHENGMPVSEVRIRTLGKIATHFKIEANTTIDVPRQKSEVSGLSTNTNLEGEFLLTSFPEALAPGVGFELVCEGTYFGPYHLQEGEELGPLELVIKAQGESEVPVQFTVQNRKGEPIRKALAQLIRIENDNTPKAKASFFDWTFNLANSMGEIRFSGMSPGVYELRVMDISGVYAPMTKSVQLIEEQSLEETLVLVDAPAPPQEIRGTVLDSSGNPLPDMTVVIEPATGSLSCSCFALTATTDAQGEFNLGSFMKGDHRISITHEDSRRPLAYYYPARPGEPIVIYLEK